MDPRHKGEEGDEELAGENNTLVTHPVTLVMVYRAPPTATGFACPCP